ncbi:hypothetical protein AB0I28_33720 [Phytomonospora sp. NPDC050363]|uniref:hypothetical protein n=1 Tax=Phytomonospora sp. NPDC050363 TaxID=3155642 RepID=UPI0033D59663
MGNGDGIYTPTDELKNTAEVLKALKTSAEQIETLAKEADPPMALWGPLGMAFMWPFYQGKADEVRDHIKMIGDALDAQGEAVRTTAETYQELDEGLSKAFERFLDKLSGGKE